MEIKILDLKSILDITYPTLSGILIMGAIITSALIGFGILNSTDPDHHIGYFKVCGATLVTYAILIVLGTYYETYRTFEEKDIVYYNLVSKLDTMSVRNLEKSTLQLGLATKVDTTIVPINDVPKGVKEFLLQYNANAKKAYKLEASCEFAGKTHKFETAYTIAQLIC